MNDKDIINCAEECIGEVPPCSRCPFDDESPVTSECMSALITKLLALINRQEIEIERLNLELLPELNPTKDVVEVVRCENCKYVEDLGMSGLHCNHPDNRNPLGCRPCDYCNDGKRKEDE